MKRRWLFLAVLAWAYRFFYLKPDSGRQRKYFSYVVRHKWFVYGKALSLGVAPHQAILHDWSKFLPSEWTPYSKAFYAPDGTSWYHPEEFTEAWNYHQKRNPHHWQYWLLTWDHGGTDCLPMPHKYRAEMLADWRGAGRALGKPDTVAWYLANKDKMQLHPDTRTWIEGQLEVKQ